MLILAVLFLLPIAPVEAAGATKIIGPPTTDVYQMQEWAIAEEATDLFVTLAPIFYETSVKYGIDPAVVYTQSAKETNFMKFTGVLDASFNNPCGLKITAGGGNTDPNAHKRFANWEEGITAMVHHLALYAGHKDFPMKNTPDPRHFPSIYGKAPTVELLGGKWAPSADYGNDIVRRMAHLYTMPQDKVFRLSGNDRYQTSAVTANFLNRLTRTVIVANGEAFADALVATPLANTLDAPVLLTAPNRLSPAVTGEIAKSEAGKVVILGGTKAVSASVEKQLTGMGLQVTRIAGANRFETAIAINAFNEEQSKKTSDKAILANGLNFADALSIAPYAGKQQIGIYLVGADGLDSKTQGVLSGKKEVMVIGGEVAVPSKHTAALTKKGVKVTRISGTDRYETSSNIAKELFADSKNFMVANGLKFPDALVGAPVATKYDAPILLTDPNGLSAGITNHLQSKSIRRIMVMGGKGVVSDGVFGVLKGFAK